jgi:hypothetical protein
VPLEKGHRYSFVTVPFPHRTPFGGIMVTGVAHRCTGQLQPTTPIIAQGLGPNHIFQGEYTMTTMTFSRSASSLKAGIGAGLIGGLAFGLMMGMMGMLPMVGMLVGSESAVAGFIVHMFISAFIGAVYGIVAERLPSGTGATVIAGVVNGVVWWVAGALVMMPLMLGMGDMVFRVGAMQWQSLMGHLVFGVVAAFAFLYLQRRA